MALSFYTPPGLLGSGTKEENASETDALGRVSWEFQDWCSEAFRSLRVNFVNRSKGRALAGSLEINFWRAFQVLLPLVDQYFTNHRLYFLSSPLKPLSSSGYASHKEKEMVAR